MKTQIFLFFKLVRRRYHTKTFRLLLVLFLLPVLAPAAELPAAWVLDTTVNGVEFYHSIQDCNGKKVVLLKFNNTNKAAVKISWKEIFATQVETKAAGGKGQKELVIPTGITMPASCSDMANKKTIILSSDVSPAYVAEIRGFEFSNINVSKTN